MKCKDLTYSLPTFFINSFIEIQFTCHKTNLTVYFLVITNGILLISYIIWQFGWIEDKE